MFLENLCGGNFYIYNVLRGFCRILLTSREEGRRFQTCVWVHGPPATMKSTWVNLVKLLVPASRIQEQSKIITPFTAGQLSECDLLILSDLQAINKDVIGLLKALIGRDTVTLQEKFVQEIGYLNPSCQVLIVSNSGPEAFYDVANDEGMMNRIITVEYTDEQRIPPELQIAGMEDHLKTLIVDLFNWAVHAPSELLQFHIRNNLYRTYAIQNSESKMQGWKAFLHEWTVYDSDPDAFVTVNEIMTAAKSYQEKTGDLILGRALKNENTPVYLSKLLPNITFSTFQRQIRYQRYSKSKYPGLVHTARPYGFKNLALKNRLDKDLSPSQEPFKLPSIEDQSLTLPDAFYTNHKINWIAKSGNQFTRIQEEIKRRRLSAILDADNSDSTSDQTLPSTPESQDQKGKNEDQDFSNPYELRSSSSFNDYWENFSLNPIN